MLPGLELRKITFPKPIGENMVINLLRPILGKDLAWGLPERDKHDEKIISLSFLEGLVLISNGTREELLKLGLALEGVDFDCFFKAEEEVARRIKEEIKTC